MSQSRSPLEELNNQLRQRQSGTQSADHNPNQTGNTSGTQNLTNPSPKQVESFFLDPSENDPLGDILGELNSSMVTPIQQTGGSGFKYQQSGVYQSQQQNQSAYSSNLPVKKGKPTIVHKIISYSFFLFFVFIAVIFNIHLMERSFQITQMDCRENKCYRENVLDYNRKTWLNIQKMTYDDCYDNQKKQQPEVAKILLRAAPGAQQNVKKSSNWKKMAQGIKNVIGQIGRPLKGSSGRKSKGQIKGVVIDF